LNGFKSENSVLKAGFEKLELSIPLNGFGRRSLRR